MVTKNDNEELRFSTKHDNQKLQWQLRIVVIIFNQPFMQWIDPFSRQYTKSWEEY